MRQEAAGRAPAARQTLRGVRAGKRAPVTSTETREHRLACSMSPAPSAFPMRTLAATLKPVGIYEEKGTVRAGTSPASSSGASLCTFPSRLVGRTWA